MEELRKDIDQAFDGSRLERVGSILLRKILQLFGIPICDYFCNLNIHSVLIIQLFTCDSGQTTPSHGSRHSQDGHLVSGSKINP